MLDWFICPTCTYGRVLCRATHALCRLLSMACLASKVFPSAYLQAYNLFRGDTSIGAGSVAGWSSEKARKIFTRTNCK